VPALDAAFLARADKNGDCEREIFRGFMLIRHFEVHLSDTRGNLVLTSVRRVPEATVVCDIDVADMDRRRRARTHRNRQKCRESRRSSVALHMDFRRAVM
jgi:hypothetical protein